VTVTIAVAGKGGTGKTTFAALVIKSLLQGKNPSILALDADPNSNLNEALGLEVEKAISEILEATKDPKAVPEGMSKHMFIEYMLSQAIIETKNIDLLVMGGPQGPGCYCYPNDILKGNMDKLAPNYDYVVVDNEAGLEHISRGTVKKVNHLFVISDGSVRGIRSAARVRELIEALKNEIDNVYLVITKISNEEQLDTIMPEIQKTGLNFIGYIPMDEQVVEYDLHARALFDLPDDSKAVESVKDILNKTVLNN